LVAIGGQVGQIEGEVVDALAMLLDEIAGRVLAAQRLDEFVVHAVDGGERDVEPAHRGAAAIVVGAVGIHRGLEAPELMFLAVHRLEVAQGPVEILDGITDLLDRSREAQHPRLP